MALGSSVMALSNPHRGDMVATLGETTGKLALQSMYNSMMKDPVGQQILQEQPVINEKTIDLSYLKSLPENTFGGAYARWMDCRGFSPDSRAQVHFVDDANLAYVMRRYREVHDFWHVLSGLETTVLAEIAVKWLEMVQTGLPMCTLSALVGPLRLHNFERRKLINEMIPWAVRCGQTSVNLMNVYYEKNFEKDLDEFRTELNFEPFAKRSSTEIQPKSNLYSPFAQ